MERSKIQRLYDACNHIFTKKQPPTSQDIQCLRSLLDVIEPIDVGLKEECCRESFGLYPIVRGLEQWAVPCEGLMCRHGISQITYIHIFESKDFSMGLFCFPAGSSLPLHNHPGMTVLSKVLYGSCYIKSYDWVKCEISEGKIAGLARKVKDGVVKPPCETSVLFPTSGGNIHSFTALTPFAILDVLSPPYSAELGRPSNYFSELSFPFHLPPGYTILEEREQPDLRVIGAPYLGPELEVDDYLC